MKESIIFKIKELATIKRTLRKEILNKCISTDYKDELIQYKKCEKEISKLLDLM